MDKERLTPKSIIPPADARPQIPAADLPGEGRPPLRTGKTHMTPMTRKNLELIGWKDGDPIPGDLGAQLQKVKAEVMQEREGADLQNSELARNWQPVTTSFVDISELPEEKQEEMRQYLAEYKTFVETQEQQATAQAAADAQIPASVQGESRELMRNQLMQGQAAAAAREANNSGYVIDDRETEAQPVSQPAQPPQKTAQPSAETAQSVDTGASPDIPSSCPRCAWPVATPFNVEATDKDKQAFLAAILGVSRFEKKYSLLNGNMEVVFRSLNTAEVQELQKQLGHMVRSGAIRGDAEYWANMTNFRVAMAVSQIIIGGNTVYHVPPLKEWADKREPLPEGTTLEPTEIPYLLNHFHAVGATQEPIRRIIGTAHQQFQRLTELLEAMTNEPNFWNGIKLHA